MHRVMSFAYILLSFQLGAFISFPCLVALIRIPSKIFNTDRKLGIFPYFWSWQNNFRSLMIDISCEFFLRIFHQTSLKEFSPVSIAQAFSNVHCIISNAFFLFYRNWHDYVAFVLCSTNIVNTLIFFCWLALICLG